MTIIWGALCIVSVAVLAVLFNDHMPPGPDFEG